MITTKLDANEASDLALAEMLLLSGKLLAVPTETVYGLAADASNVEAVKAIFAAKGRPIDHPLIVHIAGFDEIKNWAIEIPSETADLAAAFWPGPLTLLLKKAPHVSKIVTGGLGTIGLRVPAHPILKGLLHSTGLGLAAPSANPYKQLSPTNAGQVLEKLNGKIDAVLDGGDSVIGLESTILDLSGDIPQVLRVGPILPSQISQILGKPVSAPLNHSVSVSGNVVDHYQPKTALKLISRASLLSRMQSPSENEAYVVLADFPLTVLKGHPNVVVMPSLAQEFAHLLYRMLNDLDGKGFETIWFEQPLQSEQWWAINDRLSKAAHS